ncbi:hypothetical protein H4R26_005512, partial [Coemansia thaxteri]
MPASDGAEDSPAGMSSRPGLHAASDTAATATISTATAADNASAFAAADPGAGAGGGNNTRSFRFLLTLALRKAQTAVTLDNGGHVEEAIRTYREAISMLGLVLSRTNEEDGRQRLLHF